ncbi:MAG: GtrA family protein [Sedimentibacter sp.]|uniref:GtrA family protein n=1 Tax=Sedimentibacter sp. TaxID=1960295 RepID=UPI0031597070
MNKKAKKEIIMYLAAGILTTIVNFAVYYALIFMCVDYKAANTAAFLVSVIFAFAVNKKYVFLSNKGIWEELARFFAGRVFTYLLDIGTMIVLVELLGVGRYEAKVWANGVVMVSNYVISKFWIFRQ